MNCRKLEERLERLLSQDLNEEERAACERHLAVCPACAELLELASLTAPTGEVESVAGAVLARTSGSACGRAESLLGEWVDGLLPSGDRELVDQHLAHCPSCASLATALARLEIDLPTLAELAPGEGFADRVLAATLPIETRIRRWWSALWPSLIRRPRLAVEMAYGVTALLVVLVTMPGSPLQAMPARALELARKPPTELLEEPLREGLAALEESESARQWEARWRALQEAGERAPTLIETSREKVRTFFGDVASLLLNAAEDSPSEPAETKENTP